MRPKKYRLRLGIAQYIVYAHNVICVSVFWFVLYVEEICHVLVGKYRRILLLGMNCTLFIVFIDPIS